MAIRMLYCSTAFRRKPENIDSSTLYTGVATKGCRVQFFSSFWRPRSKSWAPRTASLAPQNCPPFLWKLRPGFHDTGLEIGDWFPGNRSSPSSQSPLWKLVPNLERARVEPSLAPFGCKPGRLPTRPNTGGRPYIFVCCLTWHPLPPSQIPNLNFKIQTWFLILDFGSWI